MFKLMFVLVTVALSSQIAFADWTELNVKESKGNYQFTANRKLIYKKQVVEGFAVVNDVETITISPASPNSKYAICIFYDDQHSGAFLLNLKKSTATKLPLGPPIVWVSWSPKSTHAVLASYYEGNMGLYSVNLDTRSVATIPAKLANKLQEQRFDLASLIWIRPQIFRTKVTINCSPYTDEKNCDDEQRQKTIDSYQYSFNVSTLDGTAEADSSQ